MQILSVGIDIGTTTTQLVLSRFTIENRASAFAVPQIKIVDKEIIYRSHIHFTPFANETEIDGDALLAIIENEFLLAGFSAQDIATGAVIITGEAARKRNAELVLEKMSVFSGQFVVSTAGADLEAIIAGKGSGAAAYSKTHRCYAVNLDIGGGTTNIAAFFDGVPVSYCCLDIGGRQVRVGSDSRISYISPSAAIIAAACQIPLQVGDSAEVALLSRLTDKMAALLFAQIFPAGEDSLLDAVRTRGSSSYDSTIVPDAVFFSGGVADCIFSSQAAAPAELFAYGDIGCLLGRSILQNPIYSAISVCHAAETLRATVIGAGVHLVSISGSTICFSKELLPLKNVPIFKLSEAQAKQLSAADYAPIAEKMAWFQKTTDEELIALAFTGIRNPTYFEIKQFAAALHALYSLEQFQSLAPILIIEHDMAKALGQALRVLFGGQRQLICIDGVSVRDGDYIDLGQPIMNDLVIPVVIKTLIIG